VNGIDCVFTPCLSVVLCGVFVCAQRHDVIIIMTSLHHWQIVYCLWRHQQQRWQ